MGVMAIEDPQEIQELNRKDRNKLYKGKSAQVIERYLLQEGVPTIYNIDQQVSEVVIYQIANNLVGGFYRSHATKTNRDNLNAQGMEIKKMCPHSRKYGDCGIHHDVNIFDVYRILARIAGIATHREIIDLEAAQK
jgi:glutamate--cysteine ligase